MQKLWGEHCYFRVNVGLFCSTPAVAVGRAVPRKVAMEMLFTGEPISAQGKSYHQGTQHP